MLDFSKPVEIFFNGKWINAKVVHMLDGVNALLVYTDPCGHEDYGEMTVNDTDLVRNK